ncbi:MAG: phage holin family protein [Patescibacteria group bacterium]|nr:phage holin family protein [Patescibacteria group bacterium]
MKNFLRRIFLNFLSLWLIGNITQSVNYNGNLLVLFWASLFLTIFNLLIKPILNLLLMPINLITLGAFRWVINVLVLLAVLIAVEGFKVVGFTFTGFTIAGFVVPKITLSFFWALVLVSFMIEIFNGIFGWLFE